MKNLLIITAVLEAATGSTLLIMPSMPVAMLLGSALDTPIGLIVGRLAGAALLSLGIACWLARHDEQSRAAKGMVTAMLLYNAAAVMLLAYADTSLGLTGVALWPAVLLHLTLAVWCVACLRSKRVKVAMASGKR